MEIKSTMDYLPAKYDEIKLAYQEASVFGRTMFVMQVVQVLILLVIVF